MHLPIHTTSLYPGGVDFTSFQLCSRIDILDKQAAENQYRDRGDRAIKQLSSITMKSAISKIILYISLLSTAKQQRQIVICVPIMFFMTLTNLQVVVACTKTDAYGLVLGPCPNVLVAALNELSGAWDGKIMLPRTLTATVSPLAPEWKSGGLRITTLGEPEAISVDGESLPTSVKPETKGLIPEGPFIPFIRLVPGRII